MSGLLVRNFDAIGEYAPRLTRVMDLQLPRGGVVLYPLVYAVAVLIVAALLLAQPVSGWVMGLLPPWVWLGVLPGLAGLCGAVKHPEGLWAHQLALPAIRHLMGAGVLLGWRPASRLHRGMHVGEIVLVDDGSAGRFPSGRYVGPGRVVRPVAAQVSLLATGRLDRLRRVRTDRLVVQRPGRRPMGPELLRVPADTAIAFTPLQDETGGLG